LRRAPELAGVLGDLQSRATCLSLLSRERPGTMARRRAGARRSPRRRRQPAPARWPRSHPGPRRCGRGR
jgi:hypothetical protein